MTKEQKIINYLSQHDLGPHIGPIMRIINDQPPTEMPVLPPGFMYLDGSLEAGNFRIIDSLGNIFLYVSTKEIIDPESGFIRRHVEVAGHYWSAYPMTAEGTFSEATEKSPYIKGLHYNDALKMLKEFSTNNFEVSLGSKQEYLSFAYQLEGQQLSSIIGGEKMFTLLYGEEQLIDDDIGGYYHFYGGCKHYYNGNRNNFSETLDVLRLQQRT